MREKDELAISTICQLFEADDGTVESGTRAQITIDTLMEVFGLERGKQLLQIAIERIESKERIL